MSTSFSSTTNRCGTASGSPAGGRIGRSATAIRSGSSTGRWRLSSASCFTISGVWGSRPASRPCWGYRSWPVVWRCTGLSGRGWGAMPDWWPRSRTWRSPTTWWTSTCARPWPNRSRWSSCRWRCGASVRRCAGPGCWRSWPRRPPTPQSCGPATWWRWCSRRGWRSTCWHCCSGACATDAGRWTATGGRPSAVECFAWRWPRRSPSRWVWV